MIGGNGTGIPVYRKLQRAGIPFAAGILHGNDVDCEVARALAAEVIEEQPFSSDPGGSLSESCEDDGTMCSGDLLCK